MKYSISWARTSASIDFTSQLLLLLMYERGTQRKEEKEEVKSHQ
jgi:hypothetical protein